MRKEELPDLKETDGLAILNIFEGLNELLELEIGKGLQKRRINPHFLNRIAEAGKNIILALTKKNEW